jgi:hypothetical protein
MGDAKTPIRTKSEAFDSLPFEGPDSHEVSALREMLLGRATNDWMLMALAVVVIRNQRVDWAVEWIKRTLAAPGDTGDIARAITFAGLLDDSQLVRELWTNELRDAPLGGWIGVVYAHAKQRIERAWNAAYWLDSAFAAKSDEEFFARWRLFTHLADYRVLPIAARRLRNRPAGLKPRHSEFMDFIWNRICDRAKQEKNNMEGALFATRTGFDWARPWAD